MLSACDSTKVVGLLLSAIGLAIGIYIGFKGFLALHYHQSTNMTMFYKMMFLFSIISYLACIICGIFGSILVCVTHSLLVDLLVTVAIFCYYCVMLPVMLFTFTARLQFSFDKTVLRTNRKLLGFIYITNALITIGNLTYVAMASYYYLSGSHHNVLLIAFRIFLISLIGYIIVSTVLMGTFIRKLSQLMGMSADGQVEEKNQKLITIVARYLVVASFSFLSTLLVIMMLAFYGLLFDSSTYIWLSITRFIGYVDVMCNMVCLYVQFAFAADDYRRICGCCDYLCKKMLSKSKTVKSTVKAPVKIEVSSMSY